MRAKYYEYKGQKYTMKELAKMADIPLDAMRWRVRNWPSHQWLEKPTEKSNEIVKPPVGWGGVPENVDKLIDRLAGFGRLRQWSASAEF